MDRDLGASYGRDEEDGQRVMLVQLFHYRASTFDHLGARHVLRD